LFCGLLTGVPARLPAHSLVARLALGAQFGRLGVAWYPVGVLPLVLLHLVARPVSAR
jgi:hypothetical protein